jgi:transposase
MVWGCVGLGFKSELIFIDGTLNGEGYRQMLAENHIIESIKQAFPEKIVSFQQDGAPAHRARETIKSIKKEIDLIENWPPNSPDLSIIENCWGIMKDRVAARCPKSLPELKTALIEEWNALDQTMIDHMISTTPERFRLCIQNKAESIGHLLNKCQTSNIEKQMNMLLLPDGVIIPKMINTGLLGHEVICCGTVEAIFTPKYAESQNLIAININDPIEYIPAGTLPRTVILKIQATDEWKWGVGDLVVVEGRIGVENKEQTRVYEKSKMFSGVFKFVIDFKQFNYELEELIED